MSRVVKPPSEFRVSVPVELDRIVLRALDRDLQHRYRTARDMARDLERFLKGCGDSVPAMDVADWMSRVFPDGAARIQGLIELAAHVGAATTEETVVRVPSAPPVASSRGSLPSLQTLPVATTVYDPPAATRAADSTSVEVPTALIGPAAFVDPQGSARVVKLERPTAADPHGWSRRRWAVAGLAAFAVWAIRVVAPNDDAGVVRPARRPTAIDVPAPERLAPVTRESLAPPGKVDEVVAVESRPALPVAPKGAATPPRRTPSPSARPAAPSARSLAEPAAPPAVAGNGDVYVTTPGGTAEVLVDGRSLGRTPGKFRLSVGRHELLLRGESGVERVVGVAVVPDSPTLVTLRLGP
jgi:hypothetical protein